MTWIVAQKPSSLNRVLRTMHVKSNIQQKSCYLFMTVDNMLQKVELENIDENTIKMNERIKADMEKTTKYRVKT
jgi:hypothetical protein